MSNIALTGHHHTCPDWASDTYGDVTGIYLDVDDWFGFETPRELSESIEDLQGN